MGVGILGLVLVIGLAILTSRARTGVACSKITMTILVVIVLVQIVMGFELLLENDALLFSHEGNAFIIVALSLLTGGVTFWSGARRTRTST
jgi:nucleoside permease NupC